VLALLALNVGEPMSFDAIVKARWAGEEPDTARAQIRDAVSKLRRVFAESGVPDAIESGSYGYQLAIPAEAVDVGQFHALVRRAREQSDAAPLLREAVDLFQAEPLTDAAGHLPLALRLVAANLAVDGRSPRPPRRCTPRSASPHRPACRMVHSRHEPPHEPHPSQEANGSASCRRPLDATAPSVILVRRRRPLAASTSARSTVGTLHRRHGADVCAAQGSADGASKQPWETTMSSTLQSGTNVKDVDMKLEVVIIPVTDVDRSTEFYGRLGWRKDQTPPSSTPGSSKEYLIVSDVESARDSLIASGIEVGEIFHRGPEGQGSGPDPQHRSYLSLAAFDDPDGNSWVLQEITTRLPGRVESSETSYGSASDLSSAMRRAAIAHGEHEKRIGTEDANWPDWYAQYMVREQSGEPLPQ
jgi:catechol 2,3-dioxygenase-like lactoylglutathione lyase family enzyme